MSLLNKMLADLESRGSNVKEKAAAKPVLAGLHSVKDDAKKKKLLRTGIWVVVMVGTLGVGVSRLWPVLVPLAPGLLAKKEATVPKVKAPSPAVQTEAPQESPAEHVAASAVDVGGPKQSAATASTPADKSTAAGDAASGESAARAEHAQTPHDGGSPAGETELAHAAMDSELSSKQSAPAQAAVTAPAQVAQVAQAPTLPPIPPPSVVTMPPPVAPVSTPALDKAAEKHKAAAVEVKQLAMVDKPAASAKPAQADKPLRAPKSVTKPEKQQTAPQPPAHTSVDKPVQVDKPVSAPKAVARTESQQAAPQPQTPKMPVDTPPPVEKPVRLPKAVAQPEKQEEAPQLQALAPAPTLAPVAETPKALPQTQRAADLPKMAAAAPAIEPADLYVSAAEPVDRSAAKKAADGVLADRAYRSGMEYLTAGRMAEAEERLRVAIEHQETHTDARLALVGVLVNQQRILEAQVILEDGERAGGFTDGLAQALSRIYVDLGQEERALRVLERYKSDGVANPDFMATLAVLYQRQGRFNESAAAYRVALAKRPNEGRWWLGMGLSLESSQQWHAASLAYAQAVNSSSLPSTLMTYAEKRLAEVRLKAK